MPVVVLAAMAAGASEDGNAARDGETPAAKRPRRKTPGVPVTLVQPDGSEKQVHDETTPVVGTPAAAAAASVAATPVPSRGRASLDAIVPDEVIAPGIRAGVGGGGAGGDGANGRRRSPVPHLAEDDERDWGAETTSPGVGNVGRLAPGPWPRALTCFRIGTCTRTGKAPRARRWCARARSESGAWLWSPPRRSRDRPC